MSGKLMLCAMTLAGSLILAPAVDAGDPAAARHGILLLAHGAHIHADASGGHQGNPWNENVEALVRSLDTRRPTEVAFGMADPRTIQAAIDRLAARGIDDIAVIPLFVSSYSPIIGNSRYILGLQDELAKTTRLRQLDRVTSTARFRFAGAMDDHPLISEILLERALAVTDDPAATHLVLIAHGPNDDGENRLWLRAMEVHAAFLREHGGFRGVAVLTHRNDAPAPVKAEARAALRRQVADAGHTGIAIVVPLLLSAGGIEAQIEADLEGLAYRFAQPLMPHRNMERWVDAMADCSFADCAPRPD